ncbi:EamA family transporter [Rhizobium leguminosarum]|nr:EamA family transporter [Rhizobium leguminosarum]
MAVAFYYVWSVELTDRHGAAWSTLFSFIGLLPWAGWEASHPSLQITVQVMGAAAYLGLTITAARLFLWPHLLQKVPAHVVATVRYLQPVFGIIASGPVFGAAPGVAFLLGVAFILRVSD